MEEINFNINVAVVGMGLIGGSFAEALSELKVKKIYGIDINEDSLKKALNQGIIHEAYVDAQVPLKNSDLVIMALYPKDTVNFINNNAHNFKTGAVITDTCGVKGNMIEEIKSILPHNVDFVGGHPMAGREAKGIGQATKDIFKNSNYIITPVNENNFKNIKLIEYMAKKIGCKNVVSISPKEHDCIISYTSQLPHVIAVSLMNSDICSDMVDLFIGGSFRDATRVAAINSELWLQLFNLNNENLVNEIEKFEKLLLKVKDAIKSGDNNTIESILKSADENRRKLV